MLDQAKFQKSSPSPKRRRSEAHDQVCAALTSLRSLARDTEEFRRHAVTEDFEGMLAPTLGLLAELRLLEQIVVEIDRELAEAE
jgi:hypothetical protein